jgi:hypothetical protein
MFNKFIWIKRNSLSPEFCSHIIDKFEKDSRKHQGYSNFSINLDIKRSTDLHISNYKDEWKEEDNILFTSLTEAIKEYVMIHKKLSITHDKGYQIQRTRPGEFYDWHHDFYSNSTDGFRVLTYIWYLNDIQEGGYTEFIDGTRIQPETGKLLLFPATWTYIHRGVTPEKETKYICTGWLCNRNES